jgi:hypothetical protein
MSMRFGKWNAGSLYKADLAMTTAEELLKHKSYLVGVSRGHMRHRWHQTSSVHRLLVMANVVRRSPIIVTLKMEALSSSKT